MKLMKFASWCVGRRLRAVPCLACHRRQQFSTGSTAPPEERFKPRRSVMYIPGNDERKLAKIPSLNVDCAVLDCEDGVAQNKKMEARVNILKTLNEMEFGRTECAVRVNPIDSKHFQDDLEAVSLADYLPHTLMFPKVNYPKDVSQILDVVSSHFDTLMPDGTKMSIVLFIESAIGLLNLQQICERANTICLQHSVVKVDGLVFGSDDFCANIGARRSADGIELLYARQMFVTCAKAYGMQAIDMVHIDYKDLDGLREQSIKSANMGFTGKQVIHPTQIPVVQEAFSPSPEHVEWARALISAFEKYQASGKGAFNFRGKMIDMPLLLQAKNIVALSDSFNFISPQTLGD